MMTLLKNAAIWKLQPAMGNALSLMRAKFPSKKTTVTSGVLLLVKFAISPPPSFYLQFNCHLELLNLMLIPEQTKSPQQELSGPCTVDSKWINLTSVWHTAEAGGGSVTYLKKKGTLSQELHSWKHSSHIDVLQYLRTDVLLTLSYNMYVCTHITIRNMHAWTHILECKYDCQKCQDFDKKIWKIYW